MDFLIAEPASLPAKTAASGDADRRQKRAGLRRFLTRIYPVSIIAILHYGTYV
jgi:hypothetical protein